MIYLDYVIVCILGLLIGRFMNVCIYRIPRGESIAFPPSHCSRCIHPLSPMDLIAIKNFLNLVVRDRRFKEKNSVKNPLVELLVVTLFILTYYQYGFSLKGLAAIILVCTVITTSVIDLTHRIIPNSINLFIAITGIIFMLMGWTVTFKESLLGFAIGGGVLLLLGLFSIWILKKEGMGGGDIKLAAACGIYLGVEKTVFALISTAYLAGFILLVLLAIKKVRKDQYIPFGPFLSAGVIIVILFFDKFAKVIIRN